MRLGFVVMTLALVSCKGCRNEHPYVPYSIADDAGDAQGVALVEAGEAEAPPPGEISATQAPPPASAVLLLLPLWFWSGG